MIIYIQKRYWFYHENSDYLFKDTRENYLIGLGTAEGSFVHFLGPVVDGNKEEGERLLDEYNDPDQYRSEYFSVMKKDLPF